MLWYYTIKAYLKTTLYFYFKRIIVVGQENIPKNEAVMFVSNHQNALMDSLLIATTNKRYCFYLARASVFKNPIVKRILHSVNMIPIYRIRDGWKNLDKNKSIFDACYKILNRKKALLIFPEGNHNLNRRIRPLSKGFTKIIFGTLARYKSLNIYVVPVGLNYDEHLNYPQSVSIYYGKAFLANPYFDADNFPLSARKLTQKVSKELKLLTTHIDDLEVYDEKINHLKNLEVNFLNPIITNKLLQKIAQKQSNKPQDKTPRFVFRFIYGLVLLCVWLPYLFWRYIKPKIPDKVFTSTFRYTVAAVLIPMFCIAQIFIIYYYIGLTESLWFTAFCFSLIFLLKWLPERYQ